MAQYWMLCHNCDVWHMPEPCPKPLHKCIQCGHGAHLEVFCPVKPIKRHQPSTNEFSVTDTVFKTSNKRQRTNEPGVGDVSRNQQSSLPDLGE